MRAAFTTMPTVPVIHGRLNRLPGSKGRLRKLRVEVLRVEYLVAVERQEESGFDERFDGIFARLDEIEFCPRPRAAWRAFPRWKRNSRP